MGPGDSLLFLGGGDGTIYGRRRGGGERRGVKNILALLDDILPEKTKDTCIFPQLLTFFATKRRKVIKART